MLAARSDAPRRARRERDEAMSSLPRIAPYVKCGLWTWPQIAWGGPFQLAATADGSARNDVARPCAASLLCGRAGPGEARRAGGQAGGPTGPEPGGPLQR